MKDIYRLGRYLRPYKGRILMAVAASFIATVFLGGFWYVALKIIRDTLSPPTAAVDVISQVTGGLPDRHETPEASAAPGAAGDTAREPAPAGAASEGVGFLEGLRARLVALRGTLAQSLGFNAFNDWLKRSPFTRLPPVIVLLFLLKGIFNYFSEYWLKWVGFRTIQDLRLDLFERVLGQSARFYTKYPTGVLMSRVMGDVGRLQKIASTNLADAVRLSFTVLFAIVIVFVVSWRLSLVCLIGMPLVLIPLMRFGRKLKTASRSSQEKSAEVSNVLNESISGNRIVKAFGMEAFELARFKAALVRLFRADARALRVVALTGPFLELVGAVLGAGLFWYAGLNIGHGVLDGPGFFFFLLVMGYLFVSLKSLSSMNNDLQQATAAAARVFEMMDMENEIVEAPGAVELRPFSKEVRLSGVRFGYDDRIVLDGIDLVARAGEVHALVGSSGAGKTTLVNLIPRFYDVTGGELTVDGVDVRKATLTSLRRQVALVTQETILFNDSVRNNIAYGNAQVPIEQVMAAAGAANAHDFITLLPQGYETSIGERGALLSAGQRQRITIARAFLKNAPILILDEATSALDAESELLVQRALEVLMRGRTSIVIAHRLSTIRRADQIHVLERGRIVESGRHEELIARGGPYARLYAIQFQEKPTPGGDRVF